MNPSRMPGVGVAVAVVASAVLAACASSPSAPPAAPAAAPAAPPAWQQGRSAAMASSTLAPLPGKLTVTPASAIPLNQIKVPEGFKVELWATGIPGARAMVRAPNGNVYVGTRTIGRVYEVADRGGQRTSRVVVDKLNQPSGVEFRNGSLYVMAIDKFLRFDGIEANPGAQPVDITAAFKLPPEQHHNWKYIRFGPDGKLYVPFGAPCNICVPPTDEYAQIRRYNPDGSGMEVIARGVRNSVGFDWHPQTREMWFTDHGRDWLGDNTPNDELNRMTRTGLNYGFPYCHENGVVDPDVKKADPCEGVTRPAALMGPHAAVMGVMFYSGSMFPAEYRQGLFVARKGSWNSHNKIGFDVVFMRQDAAGNVTGMQPFMTGFHTPGTDNFWGRPAYAMQMPDGSMLVSDEQVGAIYRVSYGR